mmetsp:Transcript_6761/g.27518  ORF Transcript_6761/g.27518 Transcript_6761/m.27518 type:complete len:256 (-) Transcript_6761:4776-5543(-)
MRAGHEGHTPVPASAANVSGGHASHRVEPGTGVCVPGGHAVHVVWSKSARSLYKPDAHGSHAPSATTTSPPGHCTLNVVVAGGPSAPSASRADQVTVTSPCVRGFGRNTNAGTPELVTSKTSSATSARDAFVSSAKNTLESKTCACPSTASESFTRMGGFQRNTSPASAPSATRAGVERSEYRRGKPSRPSTSNAKIATPTFSVCGVRITVSASPHDSAVLAAAPPTRSDEDAVDVPFTSADMFASASSSRIAVS